MKMTSFATARSKEFAFSRQFSPLFIAARILMFELLRDRVFTATFVVSTWTCAITRTIIEVMTMEIIISTKLIPKLSFRGRQDRIKKKLISLLRNIKSPVIIFMNITRRRGCPMIDIDIDAMTAARQGGGNRVINRKP